MLNQMNSLNSGRQPDVYQQNRFSVNNLNTQDLSSSAFNVNVLMRGAATNRLSRHGSMRSERDAEMDGMQSQELRSSNGMLDARTFNPTLI